METELPFYPWYLELVIPNHGGFTFEGQREETCTSNVHSVDKEPRFSGHLLPQALN